MKLSPENVVRLLTASADKGATTKEMLIALAQKKRKKTQLRKILKDLTNKKICYKQNNRYYLLELPPQSLSRSKGKPPALAPPSRRSRNRKDQLGMVLCHARKEWLYSFAQQKKYSVARGSQQIMLHGDLVKYTLVKNKQGETEATLNELVERRITCLKGQISKEKKGRLLFFADTRQGAKRYKVLNTVEIKKEEQLPAWLDISSQPLFRKDPEGYARLLTPETPEKSPLLTDILAVNKIPTRFPESVLAACQSLPKSVRLEKDKHRADLRKMPFVTIDGDDAKDFDDAIYAEKEKDQFRLWVSIADVAEYVPPGSVLDREAFCRGTSTYLPGIAYPMLPEPLSNGLCSLKEGLNRKTLTCECLIDKQGKVLSSRIYPSINRIACRLTYPAVDRFFQTGSINTRKKFAALDKHLLLYREIAQILRRKRIKNGFVDFHLPETSFRYDQRGHISDIVKKYQTSAMQVIEQFMLLANEVVAGFCDAHKLPIVWRNHPPPLPEKLNQVRQLLWNNHIRLPKLSSGKDYNQALKLVKNSQEKDYLEYALLRSMSLAVYETSRRGHFGIASTHYCHFTSPIRRYPDLLVHRTLKAYFRGVKPQQIPDYVAATASDRERLATAAERAAVRFYKLYFMADKIGEQYAAKISGMINSGVFVEIEQPYVAGFVSFASIRDDHYEYDEEQHCIWGRGKKTRYTIGQNLEVILIRLDWINLSPEFDWICWKDQL